jgi:hypothetical protein
MTRTSDPKEAQLTEPERRTHEERGEEDHSRCRGRYDREAQTPDRGQRELDQKDRKGEEAGSTELETATEDARKGPGDPDGDERR